MIKKKTVYLADDHQIIIDGLQLLLSSESNLIVIGSANDGETASKEIIQLQPNIALVDMRMPGYSGLEVILHTKKKAPNTRFVILSMHNDKRYITDAITFGAAGYILKNIGKQEMINCINTVLNGDESFPIQNNSPIEKANSILSQREIDILKMVLDECSTQQIAEALNLSVFTVDTHRKNISRKTNTKNIISLMRWTVDHQIFS